MDVLMATENFLMGRQIDDHGSSHTPGKTLAKRLFTGVGGSPLPSAFIVTRI
jgi:hypothetical protein